MRQKGYTLIEILVALPIGAVLLLVVVASYFQIVQAKAEIGQKSIALAELDNAIHWLSGDLVMAQSTDLVEEAAPVSSMSLEWKDLTHWAADQGAIDHTISYVLFENQLQRNYDGQFTIVARNITQADFSFANREFTVKLTSQPGLPGSAVTRTITSEMRTDPLP